MSSNPHMINEARWFYQELEAQGRTVEMLADPGERDLLRRADIVWGLDIKRKTLHLFYENLEAIMEGTREPCPTKTLSFLLDFDSNEPERLCAALLALKGSHCYNAPTKGASSSRQRSPSWIEDRSG